MNATALILHVAGALENIRAPHMLTGSTVASYYGLPTFTMREEIVVQLGSEQVEALATAIGRDFNFRPMTTRCSIDHPSSAFKVELFLLSDDPHDQSRFLRRRQVEFENKLAWLPTVDDVIVTKLRWSKGGRRAKDIEDVNKVLSVRFAQLDLPYIRQWTDQHCTRDLFEKLLSSVSKFA